jgi:hypothetical protein
MICDRTFGWCGRRLGSERGWSEAKAVRVMAVLSGVQWMHRGRANKSFNEKRVAWNSATGV